MNKLNLYYGVRTLNESKHLIYISKNKTNFKVNTKHDINSIIQELIDEFGFEIIQDGVYFVRGIDMPYDDICKILIFKGFLHSKDLDNVSSKSFFCKKIR